MMGSNLQPTSCRRFSTFLARFAAAVVCLFLLPSSAWSSPEFRAPYSGERVTEYEVTLPVRAREKETFRIPSECNSAHLAYRGGGNQWGNRVERRVWDKVMRDCYYVAFLRQSGSPPVHDFVSQYDFMNADLRDLMPGSGCGGPGQEPCEPLPPGVIELKQILAQVSGTDLGEQGSAEECQLRNGLFRGRAEFTEEGLVCDADPLGNGIRVVAIDFADVNADGYVDAVLRLIPIGRGFRRAPLILPLTRKAPDAGFSIPQHLARF